MLGERKRVVSERGAQLKLEDGTTVAKSHENKTWRWLSDEDDEVCGVDADVDGRLGAGGPLMSYWQRLSVMRRETIAWSRKTSSLSVEKLPLPSCQPSGASATPSLEASWLEEARSTT